jgi:NADPH-dependent 2,4-dienoyl-CoA reductase/sulfur reductase-like enzyme
LEFRKTSPVLFGVPKYAESLAGVVKEKNIKLILKNKLVEVRGKQRIAVFED